MVRSMIVLVCLLSIGCGRGGDDSARIEAEASRKEAESYRNETERLTRELAAVQTQLAEARDAQNQAETKIREISQQADQDRKALTELRADYEKLKSDHDMMKQELGREKEARQKAEAQARVRTPAREPDDSAALKKRFLETAEKMGATDSASAKQIVKAQEKGTDWYVIDMLAQDTAMTGETRAAYQKWRQAVINEKK